MTPLEQSFVDSCPLEDGFHQRGLEMTRIEVFVDAAFAFAVTMLVISFDAIPTSYDEVVLAIKNIPAFIIAVIQLVWIWHTHNKWSRRFGLDTSYTVVLSTALLIVVLIYIYPMRIMAGGMFSWFTGGYLPSNFNIQSLHDLRGMFVFLGIGFIALCSVFVAMYRYAASMAHELCLGARELHETKTLKIMWTGAASIGLLSVMLALLLPGEFVPFTGFAYALMSIWFPYIRKKRGKIRSNSPT